MRHGSKNYDLRMQRFEVYAHAAMLCSGMSASQRRLRKQRFQHIQHSREPLDERHRCHSDALRGPAMVAEAARTQYADLVDTCMETLGVPDEEAGYDFQGDGWDDTDVARLHGYTDGGSDPAVVTAGQVTTPARAGWGLAAWRGGRAWEFYGPVVTSSSSSTYLGAERHQATHGQGCQRCPGWCCNRSSA